MIVVVVVELQAFHLPEPVVERLRHLAFSVLVLFEGVASRGHRIQKLQVTPLTQRRDAIPAVGPQDVVRDLVLVTEPSLAAERADTGGRALLLLLCQTLFFVFTQLSQPPRALLRDVERAFATS